MPRKATGSIDLPHLHADGRTVTFRARVRAYGRQHRLTFGTNHEGWNEHRVRVELDEILRQIERGTWKPPSRKPDPTVMVEDDETLHVTASRWWGRREAELAAKTRVDYRWRLDHLLRYLAHDATADIDVRRVDWLRAQLRDRGLAARSVNMVLDCLAQVLDDAVEYGLLDTNPARGKRRRMRLPQSRRTSSSRIRWSTCSTPPAARSASCSPTNGSPTASSGVGARFSRPCASPDRGSMN